MLACDLCTHEEAEFFAEKYQMKYVRCLSCGLVYSDNTDFDFEQHNEASMVELQDTHVGKLGSPRHSKAYQVLLKRFAPYRRTGRLLEIGCSTGGFLSHARADGWQEIGVEPVEYSARYGIDELSLNIHIGTLESADIAPESIDIAYSNAVIEHLEHPLEVFRQAYDVLRSGGLFYADTVNLDSYTWKFLGARWKLCDPRMHLSLFTPTTLRAYCEKVGLRVVNMTTHGVRFYATRQDRPHGFGRVLDELHKAPYSWAARRNLKGDNIAVFAEKPA